MLEGPVFVPKDKKNLVGGIMSATGKTWRDVKERLKKIGLL